MQPVRLPGWVEMGAESYLISSSLRCAMSQRLVRNICPRCKVEIEVSPDLLHKIDPDGYLGMASTKLYRGQGCRYCFETGYRGRTVLSETLLVSDTIKEAIIRRATSGEIAQIARAEGMITMFQDGIEKVRRGITTLEEVLKVTEEK